MILPIINLLLLALTVYKWTLFAVVIISWIPSIPRYHPVVRFLNDITDPVLRPLRALIPPQKTGYIDFSPLIAFLVIGFLQQALFQLVPPTIIR